MKYESPRAQEKGDSLYQVEQPHPLPVQVFHREVRQYNRRRLAAVALDIAKRPFDAGKFQLEIKNRLQRLRYPQPAEREKGKETFYQQLQQGNGVRAIFSESTLKEIWNCLLIPRIILRDRELGRKRLSAVGYPVSFHHKLHQEDEKRLQVIEKLVRKYGMTAWMAEHQRRIEREFHENIDLYLLSQKYAGTRRRKELLSGQAKLKRVPRSATLAAEVAVYWVLWTRLHGRKKMSDRFIRQLSLLINAAPDVEGLESDEALRDAIENDVLERRKRLKIS
jgi:hypothetical protein